MADTSIKFTFQPLPGKKFPSIDGKEAKEYLLKWSMKGRLRAQAFSFDQQFQPYQKKEFVQAFMHDPNMLHHLQVLSSSGKWTPLGIKAESVTVDAVACSVISMTFFDRLYKTVARESGQIHKCFDEFYGDITISDELRKMLLSEEADHYDLYSETEKQEFLFNLFKHLCVGGAVCQYEDSVEPYLNITKQMYKDLVSVQKDSSTGDLHIISHVFKVSAEANGELFYPADTEHIQNFAYFIVDPLKRHLTVLYHTFGASKWE